jgi:hypothetical protein
MSRYFVDAGKRRVDSYEFGDLTGITIWLLSVNQLWTIDPADGEACRLGNPGALLMLERASFDPNDVDDEPIVSWLPSGESTLDGIVCKTYRR